MHAGAYGAGFADVYDSWYDDDPSSMVNLLASLAGQRPVLELGVGTGRLAVPLANAIAPTPVVGLDSSPEMLDALAAKDVERRVTGVCGDMTETMPVGPFSLVFASYNTVLNLATLDAQRRCVTAVAERLAPGGRFLIEAFVPPHDTESVEEVKVRSMTVDQVVLSVARYDPQQRVAAGQFIDVRDGVAPRLRPWQIRYSTVDELDRLASDAGLDVEHRWADSDRTPFSPAASRHLTVYKRRADAIDPS